MRLAACAFSAVLLSGCSWLGTGGHSNGYGTSGGAYGTNCAPVQTASYGHYGQQAAYGGAYGQDAGCAGGAYGVADGYGQGYGGAYGAGGQGYGAGYGAGAYGQGGFGQGGAGFGQAGFGQGGQAGFAQGAGFGQAGFGQGGAGFAQGGQAGFGQGGFAQGAIAPGLAAQGIGGATAFGAGTAFGGNNFGGNVVGTQLTNGQFVNGAQVQNVVGAPIYVPQPYAQPFGVPQLRGVGAALPFGLEFFGGTEFDIDGTLVSRKGGGESFGGGGRAGEFDDISYSDAFSDGYNFGAAGSYDISRNTTLLASAEYSQKNGRTVDTGSFQSGDFDADGNFVATDPEPRSLSGKFDDLEQYTIEGGVRQYVGQNPVFRPYVAATGGFAYNNDVDLTQTFDGTGEVFNEQEFIESGWRPTAAALVGAEVAVGNRGAVGIESGLRWRDNLKTVTGGADDRLSIPVRLRGRLAF